MVKDTLCHLKWFNVAKGFGFISPNDGVKDIFIHKTCLNNCNIEALLAGEDVIVEYKTVLKGREATKIKVKQSS